MIRTSWLSFSGRNNFSIPLLAQRTPFLPKQLLVEFNGIFQTQSCSTVTILEREKPSVINQNASKSASNVNYDLFKKILRDNTTNNLINPLKKELFLQNYFENLMIYPPNEIIKILKIFAISNTRPIEAIKSMCDTVVAKQNHTLTEWECSDMLYALSRLQYRHEPAVELLVNRLKNNPGSFKSLKVITSLLRSLTSLRVRDYDLMETIINSLMEHPQNPKASLSALISLCTLNLSSVHLDSLIKPLSLMEETDFNQIQDYATFIWACVLLGKYNYISEQHLKNVLSCNFIEKLDYDTKDFQIGLRLKLLSVNAAACLIPSYKGPFLHNLSQYKNFQPPVANKKNNFLDSVRNSIIYIISRNGYLGSMVNTGTGIFIDLECQLDAENSAKILSKPVENVKLGVMLLNYNDICSDGTMTGLCAFRLKILESQGYKVVVLRYSEYPFDGKMSEKIIFLRKKIQEAVEGSEEVSESVKKSKESA